MKHTPGPWEWKDVPGAGLEIRGPVHLVECVELPKGIPEIPINIYGLAQPQNILIGYERWVQFEPNGWSEMQEANARLIADAPAMHLALEMISVGVARIERSGRFREFCFGGLRYGMSDDSWTRLIAVIGWDRARAAIAKAEGQS